MTSSRTRSVKDLYSELCAQKNIRVDENVTRRMRDRIVRIDSLELVEPGHLSLFAQASRSCNVADLKVFALSLTPEYFEGTPAATSAAAEITKGRAVATGAEHFQLLEESYYDKRIVDLQRHRPPVLRRIAVAMKDVLFSSPHIATIFLSGVPFGDDSICDTVCAALSSSVRGPWSSLREIAFAQLQLTDRSAAPIVEALLRLPALESVSLAGNMFTDEAFGQHLSKLIVCHSGGGRADRMWRASVERGASAVLLDTVAFDKQGVKQMQLVAKAAMVQDQHSPSASAPFASSSSSGSAGRPIRASGLKHLDLSFNELSDATLSRMADLLIESATHAGGCPSQLSVLNLSANHFTHGLGHMLDVLFSEEGCPYTLTKVLFSGIPAALLPETVPDSAGWTAEFDPNTLRLVFSRPPAEKEDLKRINCRKNLRTAAPGEQAVSHDDAPAVAKPVEAKYRLPISKQPRHRPPPPAAAPATATVSVRAADRSSSSSSSSGEKKSTQKLQQHQHRSSSSSSSKPPSKPSSRSNTPVGAKEEQRPKRRTQHDVETHPQSTSAASSSAAAAAATAAAAPVTLEDLCSDDDDDNEMPVDNGQALNEKHDTEKEDTAKNAPQDEHHVDPQQEHHQQPSNSDQSMSSAASAAVLAALTAQQAAFEKHQRQQTRREKEWESIEHLRLAQQEQQQRDFDAKLAQMVDSYEEESYAQQVELAQMRIALRGLSEEQSGAKQQMEERLRQQEKSFAARLEKEQKMRRSSSSRAKRIIKEPVVVVVPAPEAALAATAPRAVVARDGGLDAQLTRVIGDMLSTVLGEMNPNSAAAPAPKQEKEATASVPAPAREWQQRAEQKAVSGCAEVVSVHERLMDLGW